MSPSSLPDRFPVVLLAVRNLKRSQTRSILAATGIAIGVIAIVSLGMFGSAFQRAQLENIGTVGNDIAVLPGEDLERTNFTETQLREIRRAAQPADLIAVKQDVRRVRYRERLERRTVYGIADPKSLYEVRDGSIPDTWRSGAVVGSTLAANLGVEAGEAVTVGEQTYRVIAVLGEAGQISIVDPGRAVILPPSRFEAETYSRVVVLAESTQQANRTAQRIRSSMNGRKDRVRLFEFGRLAEQIEQLFVQINLFLVGIGAVSLIVAGTSILNVMLMSTVERRAEIGVLRAVGFEKSDVLRVFLTEAAILGLAGGTAGILVSILVGAGVNSLFLGNPLAFNVVSLLYLGGGFTFGIGSGVLSGVYPAWKAATLDPVEALRE